MRLIVDETYSIATMVSDKSKANMGDNSLGRLLIPHRIIKTIDESANYIRKTTVKTFRFSVMLLFVDIGYGTRRLL